MAKKKTKNSKFRSEADRSSARGRKMRFSKKEVSPEELAGRKARNKRAAQRGAAATASGSVHSRVHKANEDENVGTEAMDYGTEAAEGAVRTADKAVYSAKMHGRKQPETVDAETGGSNPASKFKQKEDIKRQYASAKRGEGGAAAASGAGKAKDGAKKSKEAAEKGSELLDKLTKFIGEHSKEILLVAALGLLVMVIASSVSSCSAFLQSSTNVVIATSFTAEDADIRGANDDYKALAQALLAQANNAERSHPGYDEYNYYLDEIVHDPYQLSAYLTVMYEDYTRSEVQSMLSSLFDRQYELTFEEVVEVRYRTETRTRTVDSSYTDPVTGEVVDDSYEEEYEVQVPYDYYILNVTLKNNNLGHVITESGGMDADQQERYALLLQTKGNKADLFADDPYVASSEYLHYDIPGEALTDERFRKMITEAEKYLGYPYVWGGSSPSTSFDCSGFVSYVINHCGNGWNVGRLTANGLKGICSIIPASSAKPGDLIFFQGTYNTSGASHVGIYVGDGMMIHCGNPISYASINTTYWQQHFYCFGRLP